VLIRTSKGRYLLQQRSPGKEHYPLWWHGAVAGHVSAGSTPHQSACREMKEEIGITTTLEYLDAFIVDDTEEYEMVFVYFGCHDGPFYPDKSEIAQLDLIHERDLSDITRRYRLTPHAVRAFELVKK
jgi:isopentenyldiphosphate isomerase